MQGLMWREYDEQGFLVYSFAETVQAMHPYYVMRAIGGLLPQPARCLWPTTSP
jgi:cytochrome c oxidase cbb3-type subunit 1